MLAKLTLALQVQVVKCFCIEPDVEIRADHTMDDELDDDFRRLSLRLLWLFVSDVLCLWSESTRTSISRNSIGRVYLFGLERASLSFLQVSRNRFKSLGGFVTWKALQACGDAIHISNTICPSRAASVSLDCIFQITSKPIPALSTKNTGKETDANCLLFSVEY